MRRTTTLTVAGLFGLTLLTPTTSAGAAGETCRGEAATIVGTGPTVTGTEGRDVIVTGPAGQASGLGGDDLICVTGSGSSNLVSVDAGKGSDVVDAAMAPRHFYISVVLGAGADTFLGGRGTDVVVTGPAATEGIDADRDDVRPGDGADQVTTGAPYRATNSDVVDAGAGDDRITLVRWSTAPDGLVTGGAGEDTLMTSASVAYVEMSVDMTAGVINGTSSKDFPGDLEARFSSFEGLDLEAAGENVTYRGTTGDDHFEVSVKDDACCWPGLLDADTLGGDDQIRMKGEFDPGSSIDLGGGHDEAVAAVDDGVLGLDLTRAVMWSGNGGTFHALGIEDAFLMAPRVSLVGDELDNKLFFNGCKAKLRGGPGADYLTNVSGDPWWEEFSYGCRARATMHAGPGTDRLRGGQGRDRLVGQGGRDRLQGRGGNDVLLGGKGRDQADGAEGRDRCVAERERRCER